MSVGVVPQPPSPMPVVESLAQFNERIKAWDEADDRRRISNWLLTVGANFLTEKPLVAPLPTERCSIQGWCSPQVWIAPLLDDHGEDG